MVKYASIHKLVMVQVFNRDMNAPHTVTVRRNNGVLLELGVSQARFQWQPWYLRWLPKTMEPGYADWGSEIFPIISFNKSDIKCEKDSNLVDVVFHWKEEEDEPA